MSAKKKIKHQDPLRQLLEVAEKKRWGLATLTT